MLGLPAWLVEGLLPADGRGRAALRRLSAPPVAGLAFTAAIVVGHLPAVFALGAAAGTGGLAREAVTAVVLTLAMLGWWCVCAPGEAVGRRREPAAMVYLFALGVPVSGLGAALTLSRRAHYAVDPAAVAARGLTPVTDQQLGGLVLWVIGGLLLWVGITALWVRWSRSHGPGTGAGAAHGDRPERTDRRGGGADEAPPLTLPRRD